jgi:hypothetical protein
MQNTKNLFDNNCEIGLSKVKYLTEASTASKIVK